ncbi:EAL domain-containing protein [Pleurocapsales cyanobacterium LEGE 10410]|nr:EAL domain-containing protein [Pleurocapsales cyanobacterium LEGE 10410]
MNRTNILIVEDELLIAKNTAKKLEKLGYAVCKIVSSGEAAIQYVNQKQPDLILMDIAIKGDIDGIETASRIKSTVDIPIIFLTAYANDETLDRASEVGCYGYLIKPFRDRELQATIKMALSRYREDSVVKEALQSTLHEYSAGYDDIYKDNLTNLPNKLFLRDLFDYLLSLSTGSNAASSNTNSVIGSEPTQDLQQSESKLIAVFNISLDRFKRASSFLNKEQQDTLVKEIARRLTDCVTGFQVPGSTVYLESDNFVILLTPEKQAIANQYGQSILSNLQKSFIIDEQEIYLSPSIGISFYPSDGTSIEQLLQQSQKAIEYAQSQGGNRCQKFTFAFNIKPYKASDDLRLESGLHHALEREEFELYYQPKVDLQTNSIVGAEALVRWNHPEMGRIEPDKFIPLAEESGLIGSIGEWVLDCACRQTKAWHDIGLDGLKISVNLSGTQFRQSDLFHKMTRILFNSSLEAQYLELEMTETILVENIKANVQRLNLLKKLGVQIALDDFGTGYSSLGYLQQFPFDILKIDSCFIRNVDRNQVNAVITKNTISMAHELGLQVVAEGVETAGELNFLKDAQCDVIQGFIFSRPLEVKEFQKLMMSEAKLFGNY